MSQTIHSQTQQPQPQTAQFPERWEWEGENLVLAYNPYDPTRSQMRPDYSRLVGEHGVCQPVVFADKATGREIRKYVVLAKVKAPAEPGSLVPDKYFRCFRLYDLPVDPRLVDWGTLVFYEIRPRGGMDTSLNESQRFMNALLAGQNEQEKPQQQDDQWAKDFASLQMQVAAPANPATGTGASAAPEGEDDAEQ